MIRYYTPKVGFATYWGQADYVKQWDKGIWQVSTPSHGGFVLSREKYEAMPEYLKECSFSHDNNFEEDCSWCAVVLAFPEAFTSEPNIIEEAKQTYEMFYSPSTRRAHGS